MTGRRHTQGGAGLLRKAGRVMCGRGDGADSFYFADGCARGSPAGFNADYRFAASAGTRHRRGGAGLRAHLDTAPEAPLSDPASIENPPETRRIGDRRSVFAAKSGAVSRCAQDFCFFIFILDLLVIIIESLFSNPKQKQESNPWR